MMTDAAVASRSRHYPLSERRKTGRDCWAHHRRRSRLGARRHFVRAHADAEEQRIASGE